VEEKKKRWKDRRVSWKDLATNSNENLFTIHPIEKKKKQRVRRQIEHETDNNNDEGCYSFWGWIYKMITSLVDTTPATNINEAQEFQTYNSTSSTPTYHNYNNL